MFPFPRTCSILAWTVMVEHHSLGNLETYVSQVWRLRSARLSCWRGKFHSEASLRACRWPPSHCVLMRPFLLSCISSYKDSNPIASEPHPLWPHFTLIASSDLISKYSIEGVRVQSVILGEYKQFVPKTPHWLCPSLDLALGSLQRILPSFSCYFLCLSLFFFQNLALPNGFYI